MSAAQLGLQLKEQGQTQAEGAADVQAIAMADIDMFLTSFKLLR